MKKVTWAEMLRKLPQVPVDGHYWKLKREDYAAVECLSGNPGHVYRAFADKWEDTYWYMSDRKLGMLDTYVAEITS